MVLGSSSFGLSSRPRTRAIRESRMTRRYHKKKRGGPKARLFGCFNCYQLAVEDLLELFFDLHLGDVLRHRELFHDQVLRRVEHAALAERKGLGLLQAIEVAEDLGHLEERPRLDLLHEPAIAAVPGLLVDVELLLLEDVVHLADLVLLNHLAQTDLLGLVDRDQDAHIAVENLQDVELMDLPRDLFGIDAHDLCHPLRRIHGLIAYLKFEHRFLRGFAWSWCRAAPPLSTFRAEIRS